MTLQIEVSHFFRAENPRWCREGREFRIAEPIWGFIKTLLGIELVLYLAFISPQTHLETLVKFDPQGLELGPAEDRNFHLVGEGREEIRGAASAGYWEKTNAKKRYRRRWDQCSSSGAGVGTVSANSEQSWQAKKNTKVSRNSRNLGFRQMRRVFRRLLGKNYSEKALSAMLTVNCDHLG